MNSVMHPDDECRPVGSITPPPFAVEQEVWVRAKIECIARTCTEISIENIHNIRNRIIVSTSALRRGEE